MPINTNDPNIRRELEREADEEGMSTTAWAGIAVAVMVVGGIAMYAFSTTHTNTASSNPPPGIERSAPPVTTGQGGAQSRMPPAQETPAAKE
jgi:hypothetical protein